MPRPYSNDLRQRVLAAYQQGLCPAGLAKRFQLADRTVRNWIERFHKTGSMAAKEWQRGRKSSLAGREEELRKLLRAHDFTLDELHAQLGQTASRTAIWRTLQRMDFGSKKNAARRRAGPP